MPSRLGSLLFATLLALILAGCGQKPTTKTAPSGTGSGTEEGDRPLASRLGERPEGDKPVAAEARAADKKDKAGAPVAKTAKAKLRGYIAVTERAATVVVPTRGKDGKAIDKPAVSFSVIVERTFDPTARYSIRVGPSYGVNDYLTADQAKELITFLDKLNTVKQQAAADPIKEVVFTVNWGSHSFNKQGDEWRHGFYGEYYCRAADIKKALQDALKTLDKLKKTKHSVEW